MRELRRDDLSAPEGQALLAAHVADMYRVSPPGSVHVLDLDGLRRPEVSFWTLWIDGRLAGCGALKELDPAHGELRRPDHAMGPTHRFVRHKGP